MVIVPSTVPIAVAGGPKSPPAARPERSLAVGPGDYRISSRSVIGGSGHREPPRRDPAPNAEFAPEPFRQFVTVMARRPGARNHG
jgi:hypothetical protein